MSDQKLVINATTGEEHLVDLTADEVAEREVKQAQHETMIAERDSRVAARQSGIEKLAALGLTVEEISAVFGVG